MLLACELMIALVVTKCETDYPPRPSTLWICPKWTVTDVYKPRFVIAGFFTSFYKTLLVQHQSESNSHKLDRYGANGSERGMSFYASTGEVAGGLMFSGYPSVHACFVCFLCNLACPYDKFSPLVQLLTWNIPMIIMIS